MTVAIRNPDQYMAALRQIIAQCRKRVGMLIGTGAPADLTAPYGGPLIPSRPRTDRSCPDQPRSDLRQRAGDNQGRTRQPINRNSISIIIPDCQN